MLKKRGSMFFTLDVFIAAIILVTTTLILFSFSYTLPINQDVRVIAEDVSNYFFRNQMKDVGLTIYNHPMDLEQRELTVSEMIHHLLVYNNGTNEYDQRAKELTQSVMQNLITNNLQAGYYLDNTTIHETETFNIEDTTIGISKSTIILYTYNNSIYGPNITQVIVWS